MEDPIQQQGNPGGNGKLANAKSDDENTSSDSQRPTSTGASSSSSTTTTSTPSTNDFLDDNVLSHIFEFLDFKSLRRGAMQVNRRFRRLIASDEILWKNVICNQLWKLEHADKAKIVVDLAQALPNNPKKQYSEEDDDEEFIPSEAPQIDTNKNINNQQDINPNDTSFNPTEQLSPNYPLLLSLATNKKEPRGIDDFLIASTTALEEIEYVSQIQGLPAYRFTGTVGPGNRCIRANQPLQRPQFAYYNTNSNVDEMNTNDDSSPLDTLPNKMIPFVSPIRVFKQSEGRATTTAAAAVAGQQHNEEEEEEFIHLTPRFIAYYEVNIHPPLPPKENDDEEEQISPRVRRQREILQELWIPFLRHREECIAVGIATDNFPFRYRMPGWDRHSFGYHGDDGGLYHGSGHFEAGLTRLARFGAGDVVGCGIDYTLGRVFFTLNGIFLGYQFFLEREMFFDDVYPVVGMDSNCLVTCNFGQLPFRFDLTAMMQKDRDAVANTLQILTKCVRCSDDDSDGDDGSFDGSFSDFASRSGSESSDSAEDELERLQELLADMDDSDDDDDDADDSDDDDTDDSEEESDVAALDSGNENENEDELSEL